VACDGGKKARLTEEITKEAVKTTRAGNAGPIRRDRGDYARVLFVLHARLRARSGRPAFPAPFLFEGMHHSGAAIAPREGEGVSIRRRHCERQRSNPVMPLAMTRSGSLRRVRSSR